MPFRSKQTGVETGILRDQLTDLRSSLLISMPISTILSLLIVITTFISDFAWDVVLWFVLINIINGTRIFLALKQPQAEALEQADLHSLNKWLNSYKLLALSAGIIWAYVAVLAQGFTSPEAPVYLLILTGVSAGSVSYSGCYAALPILFISPPLLTIIVYMILNGGTGSYVMAAATLLFFIGMTKSSFLGQTRFREISRLKYEARQHASEMEKKSREDPLTGLLNRRGLEQAVKSLDPVGNSLFTVMLIGLDGFKSVNDAYGHRIGDKLLAKIANRVETEAPASPILARVGGDKFALVLVDGQSPEPEELARRIIASLSCPYKGISSVHLGASIGIYVTPETDLTNMLLRAEYALHAAKRHSRNQFYMFNAELETSFGRQQCIERDLKAALETDQLQNWYQPVIRLENGKVIGFESLLRWHHPDHGSIAPPEIITAAHVTGLLPVLTKTVFLNACTMIKRLRHQGRSDIRVAINISPRELEAPDIDTLILDGLEAHGLPSSMLEIEITEEAPVDSEHLQEKLTYLAKAGISIALDDFGSGFSSLASLKDHRLSRIKIDRSFTVDLAGTPENRLLVKAVIDLAKTLNIEVTAEGIETCEQARILQSMGCVNAQGYLFSPALPIEEALALRQFSVSDDDLS
ncbi:putative bifunctional diguanylate cyclase/phosphodiesterase [Aquamicrobium segne]|uniref:Bifunctional diguanylate cyclase/phosphodiesterase n=1 Tax=Aquamicrobium segne TaxID=469547 RepID=A0ABW0H1G5_9HYPH